MKNFIITACCFSAILNFAKAQTKNEPYQPKLYEPSKHELYKTIVELDSVYFNTYNTCNIAKMDSLTANDLEFYHDRGGFSSSKNDYLASIQKNICGKVTRILTKNSIEVYEIAGFGAVEFGYHSFKNIAEPGQSEPSKFMIIWRHDKGKWQISRVVSLH